MDGYEAGRLAAQRDWNAWLDEDQPDWPARIEVGAMAVLALMRMPLPASLIHEFVLGYWTFWQGYTAEDRPRVACLYTTEKWHASH